MSSIYEAVKKATVAIVASHPQTFPQRPFTTYGSGFCIHAEGVVVTCAHVFKAFMDDPNQVRAIQSSGSDAPKTGMMTVPHVIFLGGVEGTDVVMHAVSITDAVLVTGFDIALLRFSRHPPFQQGYPTLQVAEYNELHEMMEVATCGFPLGDSMHAQLGTVTSSFTKGMISSIIPAAGVARKHLKGFQLDLTATNGNSGGPVFSTATGHVIGILQGGAIHPETNQVVQGIAKAETIYPIFDDDLINKLLVKAKATNRMLQTSTTS